MDGCRIFGFTDNQVHVKDVSEAWLESPLVIPRRNPEVGYKVYGQGKSALSKWNVGMINAIKYDSAFNLVEYDTKFDIKKIKHVNGEQKDEVRSVFRLLPSNLLAYHVETPFKLPVGARVIAILHNPLDALETNKDNFYVGIIAEPLKPINNRYLIFFDDGSVQYTKHSDVRLVYASSTKVWEDVYPDSQQFIKDYVTNYPEVPLLSVTKNSRVTAEWNNKPWISKVVEVDHSLVKLRFEFSGHTEWIYRGSQRLLKYQAKPIDQQGCAVSNGLPYSIEDNSIFGEIQKYKNPLRGPVDSCIEYEGKMEKIYIPQENKKNSDPLMVVHQCSRKCIPQYNVEKFGSIPPLAIPFHLGFIRVIGDRFVYYKGPCGKVFNTLQRLHLFLLETNTELGIDHFSFLRPVRCATIFVPRTIDYKIKDISYGENIMPVECVNSLGMDMPGYFTYTNDMLPTPGVIINQDVGFLTCCDCVDDCQDKKKCSCWQLTLSGVAFNNYNPLCPSPKGYEYRRLYDFVVSGIYECNKGKTCLNRVIQNKNVRYPLQVFKTSKKGWAIRPLCDIPVGSFICTYGGQLLTESKANEDGKKFGDEYLAAVDYIEVVEKHKCGYESSPEMSEDDSDNMDLNSSQNLNHSVVSQMKVTGPSTPNESPGPNESVMRKTKRLTKRKSTRHCFGKDEQIYVMDAKSTGNIGRYLNHSCEPNVFVQNVFVDSHDVRFPWVSFFASQTIQAGTELTWNYNYEIGSIPGKVLHCYCGAPRCKKRLL